MDEQSFEPKSELIASQHERRPAYVSRLYSPSQINPINEQGQNRQSQHHQIPPKTRKNLQYAAEQKPKKQRIQGRGVPQGRLDILDTRNSCHHTTSSVALQNSSLSLQSECSEESADSDESFDIPVEDFLPFLPNEGLVSKPVVNDHSEGKPFGVADQKSAETPSRRTGSHDRYLPRSSNSCNFEQSGVQVLEDSQEGSPEEERCGCQVFQPTPDCDPTPPTTGPTLCEEQEHVVRLVLSRHNLFLTDSAGTGKTAVLEAFVSQLEDMGYQVCKTAPTGCAALNINGVTTWSFAGWSPDSMKQPLNQLTNPPKRVGKRMRRFDVLVIDEISMVENLFFERLNLAMQNARNSKKPFGGAQIVVTGDFCQLPPVKPFRNCLQCGTETVKDQHNPIYECKNKKCWPKLVFRDEDKWAFRSKAWKECNFQHINLTTIHRQKEKKFRDLLEKCRMGNSLSNEDNFLLLHHPCETKDAVRLSSLKIEVDRVNMKEFRKLSTRERTFRCVDRYNRHVKDHPDLEKTRSEDGTLGTLDEHRYEKKLEVKEGMLVVLLMNVSVEEGLVNGSQGIVIGFEQDSEEGIPSNPPSDPQLPKGNRVPTVAGEHKVHKEAGIKEFIERADAKEWPVVRFLNGQVRTIMPDCSVNERGDTKPYSLLSRTQIPLAMAWAMTTHKSQGMTLDRAIISISSCFEAGQMYVALSRTRTLQGLKVESLSTRKWERNPQVEEFSRDKCGI